jgi:signal peptidase II
MTEHRAESESVEAPRVLEAPPDVSATSKAPSPVVEVRSSDERRRLLTLIAIAVAVLLLDQLSKLWIRGNIAPGAHIAVWPGVVHLSHVWNRGAAWGMLSGQRAVLIGVSILVLCGAASMARDFVQRGWVATVGLGLIVGGAIGNLIDRIFLGHVTDMIDMDTGWRWLRTFPVFNLADSALTLGVCLLLWHFLRGEEPASDEAQASLP